MNLLKNAIQVIYLIHIKITYKDSYLKAYTFDGNKTLNIDKFSLDLLEILTISVENINSIRENIIWAWCKIAMQGV